MRLQILGIHLIIKTMNILLIAVICIPLLFIAVMGSQPMQVPQVPKGMR